jgi:DUF4097 and DUF4098 domain-containing protein YvlB
MARPLLAIGGIVLIGAGVLTGVGWVWTSSSRADAEVSQPIRTVRVDNDSGNISVHTADVQTSSVHQSFSAHWGNAPDSAYKVEGDTLVLPGCGWTCSVDYDVTVPRGVAVTGKTDSGDITVDTVSTVDVHAGSGAVRLRNVSGTARAETNSGDVELSDIGRDVTAKADSGAIHGRGLRGRVDADADSGDITISLDSAQDVHAKAGSGAIQVTVPPDRYRVSGDSGSGGRDIQVVQDPAGPHQLDLSTGSGDVTVKAA